MFLFFLRFSVSLRLIYSKLNIYSLKNKNCKCFSFNQHIQHKFIAVSFHVCFHYRHAFLRPNKNRIAHHHGALSSSAIITTSISQTRSPHGQHAAINRTRSNHGAYINIETCALIRRRNKMCYITNTFTVYMSVQFYARRRSNIQTHLTQQPIDRYLNSVGKLVFLSTKLYNLDTSFKVVCFLPISIYSFLYHEKII